MAYLLDANVFIDAKNRYYAFDFCPAFWQWLEEQKADGTLFSIDKIRTELLEKEDSVSEWAENQTNSFFLSIDDSVLKAFRRVSNWAQTADYEPAAKHTFSNNADYYLVSFALAHKHIVVTHEVPDGSKKRIKIPEACVALGIDFMTPFEMLRHEKPRFVLEKTR